MRGSLVALLVIVCSLAACDLAAPFAPSDRGRSVVQLEGAVDASYMSPSGFYSDSVRAVNAFEDSVVLSLGKGLELGFSDVPTAGTYRVTPSGEGTSRVLYSGPGVYGLVGRSGTVTIESVGSEEIRGTFAAELNRAVQIERFPEVTLRARGRFRAVFQPPSPITPE